MTKLVPEMLLTFAVTLVTAVVVTFLWSLIADGAGVVDWQISFVLAIAIGVAVPVSHAAQRRKAGE